MADTPGVRGNVTAGFNLTLTGTPSLGEASAALNFNNKVQFTPGDGDGQANILYSETRALAAATSETLDLTTGLETDLGDAVVFAKVKVIDITADALNTSAIVVGAAASNAFVGPFGGTSPTITLKPGETFRVTSLVGWPVDSTHKALKVVNSDSALPGSYSLILVGS